MSEALAFGVAPRLLHFGWAFCRCDKGAAFRPLLRLGGYWNLSFAVFGFGVIRLDSWLPQVSKALVKVVWVFLRAVLVFEVLKKPALASGFRWNF